ncbi:ATP-binding cassette domain-containing protein [Corynebacterium accolens]|uniref:ATP-binding cassette domain-containing protein n=1 Tax=Corynebacterium accolens TaxID=38284 RepID=UPI00254F03D4|nr:ATP-binding cassette domain-containing protein [Corynebacterium accolens]MDK8471800.1 ATP-binding cassette domain-containing protein [Corynebacterium accolens]MDK8618059.1 ATP-binding cassette domain-containing protein [Corynebacterium accolens]
MITTRDFTFSAGLTHGLVGRNGIGKTTLLRKIAGQIQSGRITVFDRQPFDNQSVLNRVILMGIDNPLPNSWGSKKLGSVGQTRWPNWNAERYSDLIARFDIPDKAYSALSRGQKSALGFVFAVASGCEVMLLDEPYLGLDIPRRELFYEVLRQEHGRTIVVSTHHLSEIEGLLDTIALMGENPISGPVDDFIDAFLELSGPKEAISTAISALDLPVLERASTNLGDQALVDARSCSPEPIFRYANEHRLRITEVPLERAVRALEERS